MAVLYDTHCHLCRLDDDKLPEILARAEHAGIRYKYVYKNLSRI